jgi:ABC-type sugar transport system ATPase subunit
MSDEKVFLRCNNIVKFFFENKVLSNVTLNIKCSTVMGLIGENGAGKTTLMNIISGSIPASEGTIELDGKEVTLKSPLQAREFGITFVHQELSLFPFLSVGENIMMGKEPRVSKFVLDHEKCHKQAKAILDEIGFDIDENNLIADLSPAEKQMVEIAKAYSISPKLLILDEPTSSLNKTESEKLFTFIRKLKKDGVAVVFITHRLDEVSEVSDEVVVLKDGEITLQRPMVGLTKDDMITAMVGRQTNQAFPPRAEGVEGPPIVELINAGIGNKVNSINFSIPAGRVIGIGGLEGQGQRTFARGLFGIEPYDRGEYLFNGKKVNINNPKAAIKHGIAYISDDRKVEGLVLPLSIKQNLTMLVLNIVSKLGFIHNDREMKTADQAVKELSIKYANMGIPVMYLSGGNQQKVVISKWMLSHPKLFVLNEPTKGIDVNSKLEIYKAIRELTKNNIGVVIITSDMLELIGLSDEIFIMYGGTFAGKLKGSEATEEKIMTLSAGLSFKEEMS